MAFRSSNMRRDLEDSALRKGVGEGEGYSYANSIAEGETGLLLHSWQSGGCTMMKAQLLLSTKAGRALTTRHLCSIGYR
jgi:hypothetical protein